MFRFVRKKYWMDIHLDTSSLPCDVYLVFVLLHII
jgi:hypothetical protein